MQVAWFKRTRKKYGVGRRIFLMAPLHHHYQKKGFPEPKIVITVLDCGYNIGCFKYCYSQDQVIR